MTKPVVFFAVRMTPLGRHPLSLHVLEAAGLGHTTSPHQAPPRLCAINCSDFRTFFSALDGGVAEPIGCDRLETSQPCTPLGPDPLMCQRAHACESKTVNDDHVPAPIAVAFAGRAVLSVKEVCDLLRMDVKTLRKHCIAGNIRFILKGIGEQRPRREFMLSDVMGFLQNRSRVECLSTGLRARRTTISTSSAEVFDFTARRSKPNAALRKR